MTPEIIPTDTFSHTAADFIFEKMKCVLDFREQCFICLPGGSTPKLVFKELAAKELIWDRVVFTFGDERCVPPDHADSNYGMAKEFLFDPLSIKPENILRMEGEKDPEIAAQEYEEKIKNITHDITLLGLGGDGHTAALFPGTKALEEREKFVVANWVPHLNAFRLTLTYPAINASHQVYFLVNDPKKELIIKRVLEGDTGLPASHVKAKHAPGWIIGNGN
jgi:6-phosphogluconolactonase